MRPFLKPLGHMLLAEAYTMIASLGLTQAILKARGLIEFKLQDGFLETTGSTLQLLAKLFGEIMSAHSSLIALEVIDFPTAIMLEMVRDDIHSKPYIIKLSKTFTSLP